MTSRLVRNLSAVTLAAGLATAGLMGQAGVASAASTISIHADQHTFAYGKKAYVSGHVSVGRATVTVTVKPIGHAAEVVRVKAGPKGAWSAHGPVYYDTKITASYRSASASVRVGTHVRVVTRVRGYYGTSGGYRLVHAGTHPTFAVVVAPNKTGHHVKLRLQERSGGTWHTIDTRSYKLLTHSGVAVSFTGAAGHKFRLRAEYSKDKSNLGRTSGYRYVRFV